MKKRNSIKERFDAPKDWDFEDMLDDYGMEYLAENDPDSEPLEMNMLDEQFDSPWEAIRSSFYGGRYGFDNDSFNPNDNWFRYNGYGNIESIPYLDDYLKDIIDEEVFYDWCVDQGYFEKPFDLDEEIDVSKLEAYRKTLEKLTKPRAITVSDMDGYGDEDVSESTLSENIDEVVSRINNTLDAIKSVLNAGDMDDLESAYDELDSDMDTLTDGLSDYVSSDAKFYKELWDYNIGDFFYNM